MQFEIKTRLIGDVASEGVLRRGDRQVLTTVAGVDSKLGITKQTKYQAADLSRYKVLMPGMFAYNPMRLNIGAIGMLPVASDPVLVSPDYIVFNCGPELLPEFLYYITKTAAWVDWVSSGGTGSVRSRIYFKELARMPIPVPSLELQAAAVKVLRALDDLAASLAAQNDTLERIAQTLFKSWFVDFDPVEAKVEGRHPEGMSPKIAELFPCEFDESPLGLIPAGWKAVRVCDLLELAYGKALKASDRKKGPVPVYGSGGITGYHDAALVTGPSVIVGRKGTVGSLHWEDRPFFPIDTTFYVKPNDIPLTFCYYALQRLKLGKLNTDAAVPGLNRDIAYRLDLVLPTKELLGAFDAITKEFRAAIRANKAQIESLERVRDMLLPRLITGKLTLPSVEVILAEAA